MKCPRCQHDNLASQKFCGGCGAHLAVVCPACGASNPRDQRFCGDCGASLPQTVATANFGSPEPHTPKRLDEPESSLLGEVVGAEIKLKALVLDAPSYARTFGKIVKAPREYFRHLGHTDRDSFKRAIAFMVQGIGLSFMILVMGWLVTEFLVSLVAIRSSLSLEDYDARTREVRRILPPSLAKEWFDQRELILIIRTLPEDRFRRMLLRLRELYENEPNSVERAIKGSPTSVDRPNSRRRIFDFFSTINPQAGTRFHRALEMVSTIPRYQLKPDIDFVLRNILLWYVACYAISWFMPARPNDRHKRAVFVIGARLVGFLGPLVQTVETLEGTYLVSTLPNYVQTVSYLFMEAGATGISQLSSRVSPFEIVVFLVGDILGELIPIGVAIGAFFIGTRSAYQVSKTRALSAAIIGLGLGLIAMEIMGDFIVMLLARTGLV